MNENNLEQTENKAIINLSSLENELIFDPDRPILDDKQIDSAQLYELITKPAMRETDDLGYKYSIIAINQETLHWLSTQPILDEIRKAYKTRKAMGYNPKVSLINATLYLRELYGEKLGFERKANIDKGDFEKIFADKEASETLARIIEKGTDRTNKEYRGIELEDYIKEKYQNQEVKILDVGCSRGIITERIAKNLPYAKVTGIDLDITMANNNPAKEAEYREADAFALVESFGKDGIDIVISMNLFQHLNIEGKLKAVKSFAEVLKNDGLMFIGPLRGEDENIGLKIFKKKDNKILKIDFIKSKII